MARLTKKRRQELERYWEDGHNAQRFVVYRLEDGQELLFKEEGGVAVGKVIRYVKPAEAA